MIVTRPEWVPGGRLPPETDPESVAGVVPLLGETDIQDSTGAACQGTDPPVKRIWVVWEGGSGPPAGSKKPSPAGDAYSVSVAKTVTCTVTTTGLLAAPCALIVTLPV